MTFADCIHIWLEFAPLLVVLFPFPVAPVFGTYYYYSPIPVPIIPRTSSIFPPSGEGNGTQVSIRPCFNYCKCLKFPLLTRLLLFAADAASFRIPDWPVFSHFHLFTRLPHPPTAPVNNNRIFLMTSRDSSALLVLYKFLVPPGYLYPPLAEI